MTKAELIAAIADGAGITRDQAKKALDVFTESVTNTLKSGNDVRLVGFGSFVATERKAGLARNPDRSWSRPRGKAAKRACPRSLSCRRTRRDAEPYSQERSRPPGYWRTSSRFDQKRKLARSSRA